MYNLIYILAISLLSLGCRKKQNNEPTPANIQWNKIIIKDEFQVSAFYGDIDKQMIIGTNQNILKTTDSGKTWIKVAQNVNTIRKFITSGDSLIGISGWPNYYSLNKGDSWEVLGDERAFNFPVQAVTSANHIYKIIRNADGENALPYDVLLSSDNGLSWQNVFPYQHYIFDIYVDNADKIYLGIWGATWNGNGFVSNNPDDAIIYYTKGK